MFAFGCNVVKKGCYFETFMNELFVWRKDGAFGPYRDVAR